jgi:hypothetical protein
VPERRTLHNPDNKAIRRGVFLSVADLKATIESIQEKLTRCRRTLEQIQPGCTSPKSRKRKR